MFLSRIRRCLFSATERLVTRIVLLKAVKSDISVGPRVYIAHGSMIIAPKVEIGGFTRINGRITIKGAGSVAIGKYCAIGADVKIISGLHISNRACLQVRFYRRNFNENLLTVKKGGVRIGNDVWIGDSAIILSGVTVGDGAIIGAGAVVTKDVPPYTVACGVPASVIKNRFPDTISTQLLNIKWWDWTEEKIKANREFFMLDMDKVSADVLLSYIK